MPAVHTESDWACAVTLKTPTTNRPSCPIVLLLARRFMVRPTGT